MCRSSICLCSARLWPCQDFSSQALTRGVSNKFDFDIFISRLVRGLSCMHLIKVSSIHDHSHFSKCTFRLQVELNHSRRPSTCSRWHGPACIRATVRERNFVLKNFLQTTTCWYLFQRHTSHHYYLRYLHRTTLILLLHRYSRKKKIAHINLNGPKQMEN